jgi:hypothetical protein
LKPARPDAVADQGLDIGGVLFRTHYRLSPRLFLRRLTTGTS